MKALALPLIVASCVCVNCGEFKWPGVSGRSIRLQEKRNASNVEEVTAYIQEEVYSEMNEFKKELSMYEEAIRKELALSTSQKTELFSPKTLVDRKSSKHSVEEINIKSGVAKFLFQGDIVLSKEQQHEIIANIGGGRSKRQAYNDSTYPGKRWNMGVFYIFDENLPNKTRTVFVTAAQVWMNNTCINFFEDKNHSSEDFIFVSKKDGCWSKVGRQGGRQNMSLGEECNEIGVAAHEIGHALGFWHTHSRYDRDDFVTVFEQNIMESERAEFLKQTKETNNNYGLTYDYGSLMHYGSKSFIITEAAVAGNFTILPKDVFYTETLGSQTIGFYDLLMMNMYYNCTDACKEAPTLCYNDGFAHPRNCSKCICPSGYGGQFCNERPPGCGHVLMATEMWETLEGYVCRNEVSSDGLMRCIYWIEASCGKSVKVKIVELPGIADNGCESVGVEIKTHLDQRRTGYRFCSSAFVNTTLTSASNRVPVIFYKKQKFKDLADSEDKHYDYEEEGDFFPSENENEEEEQIDIGITLQYRCI